MPVLKWLTRDDDIRAAGSVPYRLLEEVPELDRASTTLPINAADTDELTPPKATDNRGFYMDDILRRYQSSFADKVYNEENDDSDLLMEVFGLTPSVKRENRQYWGRELGFCWQLLVIEACRNLKDFKTALKIDSDEPCDLIVGKYAIDTKYRVGSGDSGTLKKFKSYGVLLREQGFEPVFLILREDNLPAAIQACRAGSWNVMTGEASFNFIEEISGFNMNRFLQERNGAYAVTRNSPTSS